MSRPRAADDFAAIRARLEELRRERAQAYRDSGPSPSENGRMHGRAKGSDLSPLGERSFSRPPVQQSRH